MPSRRSKAGDGWLPDPSFPAWAGAVLVSAMMYWLAVDCRGGRESSLPLAAATRVPANINTWNNRAVFIVSPRLTSHLLMRFRLWRFRHSFKIAGQCSFFPPDSPRAPIALIPPAISQDSKSKEQLNLVCAASGHGLTKSGYRSQARAEHSVDLGEVRTVEQIEEFRYNVETFHSAEWGVLEDAEVLIVSAGVFKEFLPRLSGLAESGMAFKPKS
jgi:hypothetical protein